MTVTVVYSRNEKRKPNQFEDSFTFNISNEGDKKARVNGNLDDVILLAEIAKSLQEIRK